jgi:hypothetical protein
MLLSRPYTYSWVPTLSRFIYPSASSNGDDTADWLSSRFARMHVRPLNRDNHLAEYRLE